jgi:hypothetical protein
VGSLSAVGLAENDKVLPQRPRSRFGKPQELGARPDTCPVAAAQDAACRQPANRVVDVGVRQRAALMQNVAVDGFGLSPVRGSDATCSTRDRNAVQQHDGEHRAVLRGELPEPAGDQLIGDRVVVPRGPVPVVEFGQATPALFENPIDDLAQPAVA